MTARHRAIILHVVAFNCWLRFPGEPDDEKVGAACSEDWRRRVMCKFNDEP